MDAKATPALSRSPPRARDHLEQGARPYCAASQRITGIEERTRLGFAVVVEAGVRPASL